MFFAGLAKGFSDALAQERAQQAAKAERDAAHEDAILQHLSASDDPEIASMALTGLLSKGPGGKPAKGLRGFMGEMQGNPMLPRIRDLLQQGRQVPNDPTPGKPEMAPPPQGEVPASLAAVPEAGGQGSAALPAGSPAEAGGPQMAKPMPAATAPPGPVQFNQGPPGPSVGTHTVPRQVFASPAEKAQQEAFGQTAGKYQAEVQAYATMPPDARKVLFPGRAVPRPIVTTDKDGNVTVANVDGEVMAYLTGAGRASQPPAVNAAHNLRVQDWIAANPGSTPAQGEQAVLNEERLATVTKADMAAATLATAQRRPAMDAARLESIRIGSLAAHQRLNGSAPMTDVQAWQVARTSLPPTATPADLQEMHDNLLENRPFQAGMAPEAPAAAPAAPGAATGGTAASTPPPAPGASPTRRGAVPARLANEPRGAASKPNVTEQTTLDTIAAARPMMARVQELLKGREDVNTITSKLHGLVQTGQTWAGFSPSDPTYKELEPLVRHLQVFATSPYLHGIRNGEFVKRVMDNTPNSTDTPMRMLDKLTNLEDNFQKIEASVQARKGVQSAGGSTTPPPVDTHPEGQRGTINGQPAVWKTVNGTAGWYAE